MASSPFDTLSTAFGRLSDREQKLVGLTAVVALLFVFAGAALWTSSALDGAKKRVRNRKEVLDTVLALESRYSAAELALQRAEARLRNNNTSLFSLIQTSAGELGLTVNDLNERKTPVRGNESIEEISVEVNLKEVTVDKLSSFLEKIEGRNSEGLVKVTRLKVDTRHDNDKLLDVKMTVATWKTLG